MNPLFEKSVYQNRREKLTQLVGHGIAVFLGNHEAPMNYPDNTYNFRQDSDFLYFFGLSAADLAAVIDFDAHQSIIFGNDFTIDDIIWMGDQPTIASLAAQVGVTETRPLAQLEPMIREAQQKGRKVHFIPQYRGDNQIWLSNMTGINVNNIREAASVELIKGIVELRSAKEACEIEEMEKACEIGVKMHTAVMRHCVEGASEHHNGILQKGNMLLMDAGAEGLMNYCSDYTRTLPVNGRFTTKQQEIYEIVLKANLDAIDAAHPGMYNKELHRLSCEVIAQGLKDLGLMKGDVTEAVEVGAHALFMVHGLGHQIGLDVHDMEGLGQIYVGYDDTVRPSNIFGWASLRMARELRPGFVVSIEPGIYFIPHLIDIWKKENKFPEFINYDVVEKYRDFGGIRIEDDLLITETGHKVLGPHLPKGVEELADIIGK